MFGAKYRVRSIETHSYKHGRIELRSEPGDLDATLVVPKELVDSFKKGMLLALTVGAVPESDALTESKKK